MAVIFKEPCVGGSSGLRSQVLMGPQALIAGVKVYCLACSAGATALRSTDPVEPRPVRGAVCSLPLGGCGRTRNGR